MTLRQALGTSYPYEIRAEIVSLEQNLGMDPGKPANIFGAETIKEIYKDGLSEPTKEVGKAITDVVKGLRLFTAPIQLLGAYQDRLVKFLDKVREGVPEENQIPAPPEIAGPVIENLKYVQEDSCLTDFYLNLLQRSIDKERINEAHPAFVKIIEQLSRDEAYLLLLIKRNGEVWAEYEAEYTGPNTWVNRKIVHTSFNIDELYYPNHYRLYIDHLQLLNLTRVKQRGFGRDNENRVIRGSTSIPSDFGKLFIKACVPENIK